MPTTPRHGAPRPWIVSRTPHEGSKGRDEHQQFYHSAVWRAFRLRILQRDPLCVECAKEGIIRQSTIIDHIKALIHGGDRLAEDNAQGLCKQCHDVKSAKERWMQDAEVQNDEG